MTTELVYRRRDGRRVAFSTAALELVGRHRQVRESAPEAGGVLLGRIIANSGDVVVDGVTEPVPDDARTRFSFLRKKGPAQREVDIAWTRSNGTRIYLGEWHSHPEGRPTPSSHDIENWRAVVANATYEQDGLLFVIIGLKQLGVWELRRGDAAPVRLERCATSRSGRFDSAASEQESGAGQDALKRTSRVPPNGSSVPD